MSIVQVQQVYNLSQVSQPDFFRHNMVHFESDNFINVMDKDANGAAQITTIKLKSNQVDRKPNKGESAISHPNQNILTLKAKNNQNGHTLQIWNLDSKQKLLAHDFVESIQFWKWVSNNIFAVVTNAAVYHIDISQDGATPQKIFSKSEKMQAAQVIGYHLQPAQNWAILYGISSPDRGVTINGCIQLYKKGAPNTQDLQGHCACFADFSYLNDGTNNSVLCYFDKKDGAQTAQITFKEVDSQSPNRLNKQADFPLQQPSDFPIYMSADSNTGLLYCVTKFGYVYIYEISTGSFLKQQQISQSQVFIGTKSSEEGVLIIAKDGQVSRISANKPAVVQFLNTCQHIPNVQEVSMRLAVKYGLPGTENMLQENFSRFIQMGDIKSAANVAAGSSGSVIRNKQTIDKLKQLQFQPGQPQPIIIYFLTLLERVRLNEIETQELALPILQQNKKSHLQNWINQDKLTFSEQLGDLVKNYDVELALTIYKKGNITSKITSTMLELGKSIDDVQKEVGGANIDYSTMIKNMVMQNPEGAAKIAINAAKSNPNMNIHQVAEIFKQANKPQQMCAFLQEAMVQNRDEDGPWQTMVLQYYLQINPHFAQAVLQQEKWTKFDRLKIAQLCEQKGLFQNALQNYNEIKDIRRVILNAQQIQPEWLVQYLTRITAEWSLLCMQDMIKHNRNTVQIAVQVCQFNFQNLGIENCIKLFESIGQFQALYTFLQQIIDRISDPQIYFKYIQAAAKSNQIKPLIDVIKDKIDAYDANQVKEFLKEIKLADPKPFMLLCDIHGFIDEMTRYLYTNTNNFKQQIEFYLFKVNLKTSPTVLGTLIDLECDENYIKQILFNLRGSCPISEIIEVFDKRNKTRLLENWLDQRNAEGNQLPEIHNALAKIKIDNNEDPENFLLNNQFYDPKVIGKFCEERDPHLAVIAYKRSWGTCDNEMIEVTNKNSLFRLQARYLVERQDESLWERILDQENEHRKDVIDQVIGQALPESKSSEEVSSTIQAFLKADLPLFLIDLLEKIILKNSEFSGYQKLQNLLIKTAIKADTTKVINYINRIDNYDPQLIGDQCVENGLFEEAFTVFSKHKMESNAINVLIENVKDITRAHEFAEKLNNNDLYQILGIAHLNKFEAIPAINCFMKCKELNQYHTLISLCEGNGYYQELIKYLNMCRDNGTRDMLIDNSLVYCYAQLQKNKEIEHVLSNSNSCDATKVGDRCFDCGLFEAAKILYISTKNNSKLASTLVKLSNYTQAVEAAKLANTSKTWRELCFACVEAQEFRLAAVAGMNIIIHADHLEQLIQFYEQHAVPDEMIALLETGTGLERAHVGIYTGLGILYAKYKPEKLYQYCKNYSGKMNSSKILKICKKYLHWEEAAYLHEKYEEFDDAVIIMIEHSPSAFKHETFQQLIQKVSNYDLYYKGIQFYLDEQPQLMNDYLKVLHDKLDLNRVIGQLRRAGYLPLIIPFLESIQNINNKDVNEALNELYLECEDFEKLRESIGQYGNFDGEKLAKISNDHQLMEFRRIASLLYRKSGKYLESIELSKKDKAYRDAIETAFESQNQEIVENLLRFFVENKEREYFAACCYTNYELLKADIVLELAWRADYMSFAMPFFIQTTHDMILKLGKLEKKIADREKKEKVKADGEAEQNFNIIPGPIDGPLALGGIQDVSGMGGLQDQYGNQISGQSSYGFGQQSAFGVQSGFSTQPSQFQQQQFGTYGNQQYFGQ